MKKIISGLFLVGFITVSFADAPVVDYSSDIGSSSIAKTFPIKAEESIPYAPKVIASNSNLSIEQRITKLERQIDNANEQKLASKVEELQQRLQKANGQLDDQAHQIEQLNTELKSFYQDLNQRLEGGKPGINKSEVSVAAKDDSIEVEPVQRTASSIVPAAVGTAFESAVKKSESAKKPLSTDNALLKEQQMYQTAIDLLPDKKYEASGSKLREYLKQYPKGVYVANAHYWLGEINFLQKNFDAAEEEFKVVITKHPTSKRISDAMLKIALVHQNQGREAEAKRELKQIMKSYPGTSAAQLAKQQLAGG